MSEDNKSELVTRRIRPLGARYRDAYVSTEPERERLKKASVLVVNWDTPATVATVFGALPEILALRAELREHTPRFDQTSIDNLERYALALFHAHMLAPAAAAPPEVLVALGEEATEVRQQLVLDHRALSNAGLGCVAKVHILTAPCNS